MRRKIGQKLPKQLERILPHEGVPRVLLDVGVPEPDQVIVTARGDQVELLAKVEAHATLRDGEHPWDALDGAARHVKHHHRSVAGGGDRDEGLVVGGQRPQQPHENQRVRQINSACRPKRMGTGKARGEGEGGERRTSIEGINLIFRIHWLSMLAPSSSCTS